MKIKDWLNNAGSDGFENAKVIKGNDVLYSGTVNGLKRKNDLMEKEAEQNIGNGFTFVVNE